MTYYYACSYLLASGSIIEKGNWGRICRLEGLQPVRPGLLMEMIFENIRLKEFPDRPSRFDCNFLCPNLPSLHNFKARTGRIYDLFYEVELIDTDAKRFETDWSLASSQHPNIIAIEETARKYWSPQKLKDDVKEVLVESGIKITRRL